MTMKRNLGQFFTPNALAERLVHYFTPPVSSSLELGSGDGALGKSFIKRFPEAAYYGVEKGRDHFLACSSSLSKQTVIHADAYEKDVFRRLGGVSEFDTVLGNPPFIPKSPSEEEVSFLEAIFNSKIPKIARNRAELFFVAKSISALKSDGEASFILPASFLSSGSYAFFRRFLITQCSNIEILEIPRKVFEQAEVSSAIVSFKNTKSNNHKISLGVVDETGGIMGQMQIPAEQCLERMDYSFHRVFSELNLSLPTEYETLASIGCDVSRGRQSRSQLEESQIDYFHTTSFPKENAIAFPKAIIDKKYSFATCGDILTARVGSRCLNKQVLVNSGSRTITDCIYRLRVKDENVDIVMRTLTSDFGRVWRELNSQGSCARYIVKGALLSMPIL